MKKRPIRRTSPWGLGYVGQVAPNFGINNLVLFMHGPDDGYLHVAFQEDSGIKLTEFRERLRKVLPRVAVGAWDGGATPTGRPIERKIKAHTEARRISFGFGPGDIVSSVNEFSVPRRPSLVHWSEPT